MLPNKANICFNFSVSLIKAMPLRALSPPPKLLSSAKSWLISSKTKPISEGGCNTSTGNARTSLFPFLTEHKSNDGFAVATRTKFGFWKNTWGTQRKNTTRKAAQKVQHKLLFLSAAETTTTLNAINQFQVMGKRWKLSVRAFSDKAFLIWCLWNNYPSASVLITCISLPTLRICKKYIMQWTKNSPKTQFLQNANIPVYKQKEHTIGLQKQEKQQNKNQKTTPQKTTKNPKQTLKKYFKNPTKTNAWPSPKLLCRSKSYN